VSNDGSVVAPVGRSPKADLVTAWVFYVVQLAGEALLGMFWLMSVMAGDSCGATSNDLKVCDSTYFVFWWFAYAAVLVAAALFTPVAIIVADRRGAWCWPWPVLAIVVLTAATVGYGVLLSR
jgi:hypothetical protein